MKLNMKTGVLLLVATALFSFGAVQAQPGWGKGKSPEMMQLKHEQAVLKQQEKLLRLKTALELREDQLSAWNDYETFMLNQQQERHAMMQEIRQRRMENQTPPNSLELGQKNIERLEQKLASAKERLNVFTALYNVLDAEQQQTVDKLAYKKIKRMAKGMRGKGRGQGRGMGQGECDGTGDCQNGG